MNFHLGQKVVCIDDSKWARTADLFPRIPLKGEVFTIRNIFQGWEYDGGLETGLRFEEIFCGIVPLLYDEAGFQASCFRPVQITSIEIFRKMLAPKPAKEEVLQMNDIEEICDKLEELVIKRNHVSFVEVERFMPECKGAVSCSMLEHNILIWANMSEDFWKAYWRLLDGKRIEANPTNILVYLVDRRRSS